MLVYGNAVAGVAIAVTALTTDARWLLVLAAVQGATLALVVPAANVSISHGSTGNERIVALAIASSATNVAILVTPPLLAAVASAGGSGGALVAAGCLAVASSVLIGRLAVRG